MHLEPFVESTESGRLRLDPGKQAGDKGKRIPFVTGLFCAFRSLYPRPQKRFLLTGRSIWRREEPLLW